MVWSVTNQRNELSLPAPTSSGDYNYGVICKNGANSDYDEGVLQVVRSEFQYLDFTPIENIDSWRYSSIDIFPDDELKQIVWRIDSNSLAPETPTYKIYNALTDGRQYYVYTATSAQYAAGTWVFDDTLTFGSATDTPMQKIWSDSGSRYTYSFTDTLTALETKYYKITYVAPYKHYFSILGSGDWQNTLEPNIYDLNEITADEYSISSYSNIRSVFTIPIPQVTGDETSAYELQFTAWSDVNNTTISAGTTVYGNDSTTNATLTSAPHRYSFTIAADPANIDTSQLLIITNNATAANIYITDYALVPRGYFTQRMLLKDQYGAALKAILIAGTSSIYITEGSPFRINTTAYDREGKLTTLAVEAYFSSVSNANKVKKSTSTVTTGTETTLTFDDNLPPIIDLNGNATNPATPRTLIVKATLIDDNNKQVAVQTSALKFLQAPYFAGDYSGTLTLDTKKVGANPSGLITLKLSDSAILTGVELSIYNKDANISAPDYKIRFYKGTDFSCVLSGCSFSYNIPEWVFEEQDYYTFTLIPLLNTEYYSTTNTLIRLDRIFYINYKEYTDLKIFQTVERSDRTYRADEKISFTLIARDSDRANLSNDLDVTFKLANCTTAGSGGTCTDATENFKPTSYIFDPIGHFNYYFFDDYLLYDGQTLQDGNYYRVKAILTDKKSQHSADLNALLTDKCGNADNSADYVASLISSLLNFGFGCTTDQNAVVAETQNQVSEQRIVIDVNKSVTAPSYELFGCVNPDVNNVYENDLSQDLICFSVYTIGESPIDKFDFYIGNEYSDYADTDDSTKQYLKITVPFELIQYNDIGLLKQALAQNYNTTCNTLGCLIRLGTSELTKKAFFNPLNSLTDATLGNSIIPNVGADANFNQLIDPTHISGMFFWKIQGLKLVNYNNYRSTPNIDETGPDTLIKFLKQNNAFFRDKNAIITVYGGDLREFGKFTVPANIVINEQPGKLVQSDTNNSITTKLKPASVKLDVSSILFYNNELSAFEKYIPLRLQTIINDQGIDIQGFVNDLIEDPVGTVKTWVFQNILLISIVLMVAVILTYIGLMGRGK